jgi:hypothetical protein
MSFMGGPWIWFIDGFYQDRIHLVRDALLIALCNLCLLSRCQYNRNECGMKVPGPGPTTRSAAGDIRGPSGLLMRPNQVPSVDAG